MSVDEVPPGDRAPERIGRDLALGPGHERLGMLGEQGEGPVVIEILGQADRLLAAGHRGPEGGRLSTDALVERLMIAEAGQPGDAQAVCGELAQRAFQQAGMVRVTELATEEVKPFGARPVRPPEDVVRPVRRLHSLIAGAAGIRRHQAAVEQGQEGLQLVPLRVIDRVAGGDRQLRRPPGRRAAHGAERAQGGVDGVRGERLLRTLHRDDLGVPGVGEAGVQELEPRRRLDVGELQVGDVNQAEQWPAGTVGRSGLFGAGLEVVSNEMRLARADLDGPVGC